MQGCYKKVFLSIFLMLPVSLFAQRWNDTLRTAHCAFDTACTFLRIDSVNDEVWDIGRPDKPFFDSAYSGKKAILTDSADYYDTNQMGFFELVIPNEPVTSNTYLTFRHKYQTTPHHAGGFLKASFDGGVTYTPLLYMDTAFEGAHLNGTGWYSEEDTLQSGIAAYTGSSDWKKVTINFQNYIPLKRLPDTILVRFYFKSDSVMDEKAGWMIDGFHTGSYDIPGIQSAKSSDEVKVFPNPVNEGFQVEIKNRLHATFEASLYNARGQLVKSSTIKNEGHFSMTKFEKGVYWLKLKTSKQVWYKKLLKTAK